MIGAFSWEVGVVLKNQFYTVLQWKYILVNRLGDVEADLEMLEDDLNVWEDDIQPWKIVPSRAHWDDSET